jgi:two-component system OmpR family sensor kinase
VSLRSRLLIGLLGLVAVGLVASDLVTYRSLQTFLLNRLDEQVVGALDPVATHLSADRRSLDTGVPVPGGTYGAVVDANGRVLASASFGYEGQDSASLPKPVLTTADLARHKPFTVKAAEPGAVGFRVVVAGLTSGNGSLIVAVPMNDVVQTLHRLLLIELVATGAVLAGVAGLALVVVRAGLRPLEDIGTTAGAIAAGDLSRRVERAEPRTEVGRLGLSLNAMLSQIQSAFQARQASEERLRRFVGDASHELRTPLTSIRGYAEMFRRGAAERPADLAIAMRRIEEESARMGVLVEDLLLLARLDQGRPLERQPVDLALVAADAVLDARAVEPDRPIALEVSGPAVVLGDEQRLRQVAANLLANARQHTPAAAAVTVRVRRDDGSAVLEVADRGPGLFPEEADKVFERFYRADPSRNRNLGGTGLGLSIVAAVAEAHGGRARVESSPGQGARFWVELPLAGAGDETAGDETGADETGADETGADAATGAKEKSADEPSKAQST